MIMVYHHSHLRGFAVKQIQKKKNWIYVGYQPVGNTLCIRKNLSNKQYCMITDREQYIQIGLSKSSSEPMMCGVPQGSVLGPILFTIYTTSLGSLFRAHNMNYQLFKVKCGTGPAYLQELIQPYHGGRELRSASHHLLNVPFTKSALISNRAFGVAGPVLWNALPRDIN